MIYAKETLFMVMEEVMPLLKQHYDESTLDKRGVFLAPDWEKYRLLELADAFHIYTARAEGLLVGYSSFFVVPHMHFIGLPTACNDVLYMHPSIRNGVSSMRFIKFCEGAVTDLCNGFVKIAWRSKLNLKKDDNKDFGPLLAHLGYKREEIVHTKLIGEPPCLKA